jgi:hypothetical protein
MNKLAFLIRLYLGIFAFASMLFPLSLLLRDYGGGIQLWITVVVWLVSVPIGALTGLRLLERKTFTRFSAFACCIVFGVCVLGVGFTANAPLIINCFGMGPACGDYSYDLEGNPGF